MYRSARLPARDVERVQSFGEDRFERILVFLLQDPPGFLQQEVDGLRRLARRRTAQTSSRWELSSTRC